MRGNADFELAITQCSTPPRRIQLNPPMLCAKPTYASGRKRCIELRIQLSPPMLCANPTYASGPKRCVEVRIQLNPPMPCAKPTYRHNLYYCLVVRVRSPCGRSAPQLCASHALISDARPPAFRLRHSAPVRGLAGDAARRARRSPATWWAGVAWSEA